MSIQENITEMKIVPLLARVLEGNFPENSGSTKKRGQGESLIGTITSSASRRLFTAFTNLGRHIHAAMSHDARTNSAERSAVHGGDAGDDALARLQERHRVVCGLFYQSIAQEYPQVLKSSVVKIRSGWDLVVARADEWSGSFVPVVKRESVAGTFVSRVAAIVCDRRISVGEDDLGIVARGEEVIGALTDERVQTFRSLLPELRRDFIRQLPSNMATLGELQRVIGDMTLNQLCQLRLLMQHFSGLHKLASSLFWCGVRDTVPGAADAETIGIRRAWDVVRCPSSEDRDEPTVLMTPDGPAVQMTIAIPQELFQALFGGGE